MNKKKLIKWLVLIACMLTIFMFSSDSNSSAVTYHAIENFIKIDSNTLEIANYIVRKGAHMTEYFLLATISILLLKEYLKEPKKIMFISFSLCVLYAMSDEIHQYFVPGRTSLFTDVLIDSSGALIAIIIYYFITKKKELSPKR